MCSRDGCHWCHWYIVSRVTLRIHQASSLTHLVPLSQTLTTCHLRTQITPHLATALRHKDFVIRIFWMMLRKNRSIGIYCCTYWIALWQCVTHHYLDDPEVSCFVRVPPELWYDSVTHSLWQSIILLHSQLHITPLPARPHGNVILTYTLTCICATHSLRNS